MLYDPYTLLRFDCITLLLLHAILDFLYGFLCVSCMLLTSPRGIATARPPVRSLRFGARLLGFVDFGDFGDLRCLGRLLGPSWSILRPLGVILGASWGLLGRSSGGLGSCLGIFWGILGDVLVPLGHLLDPLEVKKNIIFNKDDSTIEKGGFPYICSTGFWDLNRLRMASETSQNSRSFPSANKLLFKSLLEPSWADLGSFWVPSWGPKKRSGIRTCNVWWKLTFLMKISFRNASRTKLDSTWPPKGPNMTPRWRMKKGPKSTKNQCQKVVEILIEKRRSDRFIWAGPADSVGLLGGLYGDLKISFLRFADV